MLENAKEASKREKKKLSQMNFKEKREYIWEYYKIHIILILVVLIIAGSLINNIYINPPKKPYLGFAFYDMFISDELMREMQDTLTEDLVPDEDKEALEVQMSSFTLRSEDPQMNMASVQKFAAMIAVKELDIVISTGEAFQSLARDGYFYDLSLISGINYSVDDMFFCPYVTEVKDENGDVEEISEDLPFGIPVEDLNFFMKNGFNNSTEQYYMAVVINTQRVDNTVNAINYCLDIN